MVSWRCIRVEEQLAVLNGELNEAWAEAGEPGIIINEATTARSDHASFQAIDTVTVGFGGLVDGYDCYHQTCDTIDEMLYWMEMIMLLECKTSLIL